MLKRKKVKAMDYLKKVSKQPSTWQGITILFGAFGVAVTPELKEAVIVGSGFVFTLVSIFVSE